MMDAVNARWSLPEELQQLALGGDHEVAAEPIGWFKRDVASFLQVLPGAVLPGGLGGARAQARANKGSAIDAMDLVTICRHMELDAAHRVRENLKRSAACPTRSL
jgi:hypothetical protein